jgi:hypothetical protein
MMTNKFCVGFPAHAAAEAAVLLAQGLAPAGMDQARFAHYQVNDGLALSFWLLIWVQSIEFSSFHCFTDTQRQSLVLYCI